MKRLPRTFARSVAQRQERNDLTSQLRHFARRQASGPALVCANAVIRDIERMLGRLISCGVSIEQRLDAGLPFILADAGQIEQVLVNLVLNARDAMPSGGTITIETSMVRAGCDAAPVALEPGDYAVIAVHDTGHGMDAATMQRIFEPFFTTKDPSCGLGMGLATVESIVRNARGYVGVRSIVGGELVHGVSAGCLTRRLRRRYATCGAANTGAATSAVAPRRRG